MASAALQLRRGNAAQCAAYTGPQGELVVDTDACRGLLHDGLTRGGNPINGCYGTNGSFLQPVVLEGDIETLPSGVSNYTTVIEIPAGSLLLAVSYIIKTPIGGCTQFELGIAGTLNLFGSGLGVSAGGVALPITPKVFAAATPLVLTSTAGGNFTAGQLRFVIHCLTFGPPAS
jgi:hypothetical protein